MKPQETARALGILCAAYPRQTLPKETLEIYATTLRDLDFAAVMGAIERLVSVSKWFPTVAEIRETVIAERSSLPSDSEAMAEVRAAMSRWGPSEIPSWSCPEVEQAVRVVGWQNWCNSQNPASTRARFLDAYSEIKRKALGDAQRAGVLLPGSERHREAAAVANRTVAELAGNLGGSK